MYRLVSNRKGFSLIELIVSITILAIVSIPIMAGFTSVAAINVRTKSQQEINAVMRTIEHDVKDYVKTQSSNIKTDGSDIQLFDGTNFSNGTNIKVVGNLTGVNYDKYRYDATYAFPVDDNTGYIDRTHEYIINIKMKDKSGFKQVQSFRVHIYLPK